jgi:hypothetical protein
MIYRATDRLAVASVSSPPKWIARCDGWVWDSGPRLFTPPFDGLATCSSPK